MIIVGGLYFETCEVPQWNALFGSGGRAAAAVSNFSPASKLYTYVSPASEIAARTFKQTGIATSFFPSSTAVAFSYFHPLSRPVVEPPPSSIPLNPPIQVEAEAVLRFGFLEGDAVVHADRAVYDPQTSYRPALFRANGSRADKLALVLNENEARSLGQSGDILEASQNIFRADAATFIIVKRGVRGATIIFPDGAAQTIPAYQSERVFKIGSGDVFSAVFSYYWAELHRDPLIAADLASRAVASYVESMHLPLPPDQNMQAIPIRATKTGSVLILGTSRALQDRWLLEETRWCIHELGLNTRCPSLEGRGKTDIDCGAVLILGDDAAEIIELHTDAISRCLPPIVMFSQSDLPTSSVPSDVDMTCDFTTAIYKACWQAIR